MRAEDNADDFRNYRHLDYLWRVISVKIKKVDQSKWLVEMVNKIVIN